MRRIMGLSRVDALVLYQIQFPAGMLAKHINNHYWEKPPEHHDWSREMQGEKNGAKIRLLLT